MTAAPIQNKSPVRWGRWLERAIPLVALLLLVIATAICDHVKNASPKFLTAENLLNVLRTQSPVGVVAVGMTFAILSGGIDLSVGSMVGMAGSIGVWVMLKGGSGGGAVTAGIAVSIAVGLSAGLLNGLLVSVGRLPPFIATIGGLAAYRSIAQIVTHGNLDVDSRLLDYLNLHGLPIPFTDNGHGLAVLHFASILYLLVCLAAAVALNKTRFGRYALAIGGNERAAKYSAINVTAIQTVTYVVVGLCCGLSAVLLTTYQSSVSGVQSGQLYELDAIAAVVIGGTRMSGGSGTIFGTFMGVLILGVINNMLSFLEVPDALQGLVKGVIIIVAVLVQRVGGRK